MYASETIYPYTTSNKVYGFFWLKFRVRARVSVIIGIINSTMFRVMVAVMVCIYYI